LEAVILDMLNIIYKWSPIINMGLFIWLIIAYTQKDRYIENLIGAYSETIKNIDKDVVNINLELANKSMKNIEGTRKYIEEFFQKNAEEIEEQKQKLYKMNEHLNDKFVEEVKNNLEFSKEITRLNRELKEKNSILQRKEKQIKRLKG